MRHEPRHDSRHEQSSNSTRHEPRNDSRHESFQHRATQMYNEAIHQSNQNFPLAYLKATFYRLAMKERELDAREHQIMYYFAQCGVANAQSREQHPYFRSELRGRGYRGRGRGSGYRGRDSGYRGRGQDRSFQTHNVSSQQNIDEENYAVNNKSDREPSESTSSVNRHELHPSSEASNNCVTNDEDLEM